MKVTVSSAHEYTGRDTPSVETFDLVVEGGLGDEPYKVTKTYLELRKKLNEEIGDKKEN